MFRRINGIKIWCMKHLRCVACKAAQNLLPDSALASGYGEHLVFPVVICLTSPKTYLNLSLVTRYVVGLLEHDASIKAVTYECRKDCFQSHYCQNFTKCFKGILYLQKSAESCPSAIMKAER